LISCKNPISKNLIFMFNVFVVCLLVVVVSSCGNSVDDSTTPMLGTSAVKIDITVTGASNGIFDPAPVNNGSGTFWMSFSVVDQSPNDAILPHISTRIASSIDNGVNWLVDENIPNTAMDILVPNGSGGTMWATWHYEVSRLVYDPFTVDSNLRWKLFWHRYLEANIAGTATRLFEHGWMGVSTAPTASGPWSSERKMFVGNGYNNSNDSTIGIPEYDLSALYPGVDALGSCIAFTEPGVIANNNGVYISLKCAETATGLGKVVLLKCDNELSTNSCVYIGDLINDSEAAQFALSGESYSGFSATELVDNGSNNYLILTPTESPGEIYRGCLVFEIAELASASLSLTLVQRISGKAGSFNGACGYAQGLTGSGIIYSEFTNSTPQFTLFGSKINL